MIISSGIRPSPLVELEAILDSDERIIWNGHSDGTVVWSAQAVKKALSGGILIACLLLWLYFFSFVPLSNSSLGNIFLFMFVSFIILINLIFGIFSIFGPAFWPAYRRKRSFYILTNKRAIIMTDIPLLGKTVKSYPIAGETILEHDGEDPGSIYFSVEKAGFVRIPHAAQVYDLMRSLQRGKT